MRFFTHTNLLFLYTLYVQNSISSYYYRNIDYFVVKAATAAATSSREVEKTIVFNEASDSWNDHDNPCILPGSQQCSIALKFSFTIHLVSAVFQINKNSPFTRVHAS